MKTCSEMSCDECNARVERLLKEIEKAWAEGAEYGDSSRFAYERGETPVKFMDAWNDSMAKKVIEEEKHHG